MIESSVLKKLGVFAGGVYLVQPASRCCPARMQRKFTQAAQPLFFAQRIVS